jgi:hypothetical protein
LGERNDLRAIALPLRARVCPAIRSPAFALPLSERFAFFFGLQAKRDADLVHGFVFPLPDFPRIGAELGGDLLQRLLFAVEEIERLEVESGGPVNLIFREICLV